MAVHKKFLSVLVGATILIGGLGIPSTGHATDSAATIQELNAKLNELNVRIAAHKKQVETLKSQKASIDSQIQELNQQIQDTDQQVQVLSEKLQLLNNQIADITNKITQTQKQLNYTDDLLRKRIRVMYENGDVSYMDVLMNSTDFSDFVDRLNLLSFIVKQNKDLLTSVKQLKDQLQSQQADLQKQQADQLASKAQLDAILAQQQAQRSQQVALEQQVNQNIAMTQQAIQNDQKEQDSVDSALAAAIAAQMSAQSTPYQGNPNSKWVWPVPSSHYITSGYGPRDGGFHKGVDIGAPLGTSIVAVADGRVVFSGTASGFGHWIVIQHGPGLMSVYGHMYASGLLVSVGQEVKAGQVIAKVGSDGESSGPHLHFSVATGISGGRMLYVNPMPYLP